MTQSNGTSYSSSFRKEGFFTGVDPVAVLLYLAIVLVGCLCITSATYDDASMNFFSASHFYIKQYIWVGISAVAAIAVLLIDSSQFHKYSYPLYYLGIVMLFCALFFGREVNGAKSWFELGGMRLQPVELVKISTSLA
ncbi:MAG: FtsW/RodA/SpoVE family cell cycle protein, partial [Rikenellaceae bacterium]